MFLLLHVDDGVTLVDSRIGDIKDSNVIFDQMGRLGLTYKFANMGKHSKRENSWFKNERNFR